MNTGFGYGPDVKSTVGWGYGANTAKENKGSTLQRVEGTGKRGENVVSTRGNKSLGVLEENVGGNREMEGPGVHQEGVLCTREVVDTQDGKEGFQRRNGPLKEGVGVKDGDNETLQIIKAFDDASQVLVMNERCGNGSKKLIVSYNASDLMAIDSKSCEVSIGGGISETRYRWRRV